VTAPERSADHRCAVGGPCAGSGPCGSVTKYSILCSCTRIRAGSTLQQEGAYEQ
jgi:hypothetical protein